MKNPSKSNPFGKVCEPWLARKFHLVDLRCTVRDAIASRNPARLLDLEQLIGCCAPSYVRGDYVPTIAEAYAEALRIVHQHRETPAKQLTLTARTAPPVTVQAQTIFAGNGFRVEVRLVPVKSTTQHDT